MDWSTSYQGGSSGAGSSCSSDDETDDELPAFVRGRAFSQTKDPNITDTLMRNLGPPIRDRNLNRRSSGESGSASGPATTRASLARSRSPAVIRPISNLKSASVASRHLSPSTGRVLRQRTMPKGPITLFPSDIYLGLPLPFSRRSLVFSIDFRTFAESLLLLLSLLFATSQILNLSTNQSNIDANEWLAMELVILEVSALLYIIWTHITLLNPKQIRRETTSHSPPQQPANLRPGSPRLPEGRDSKRPAAIASDRIDFGYVWMSVPKNYRESRDDGISTALILGPLIATALFISTFRQGLSNETILPAGWRIEKPAELRNTQTVMSALESLRLTRYSLVNLSTMCSAILLCHVCSSWLLEARYRKASSIPEGERPSVPRNEGRRFVYFILYTLGVSTGVIGLKIFLSQKGYYLWQHLNYFEITVASIFYQLELYMAIRLAHRGFTLGELGLTCFGGVALCLEFLNLTIARIWPITTPFIRTYRLPTPLLIFQVALIVGSFVTGFLLSPFLILSRNNAQRPVHRIRYPEEKARNRRYYALGFYIGTVLMIGGLIGFWTRWLLGNRDPWLWVIFRIVEGKNTWTRPALLCYWALLGCLSVAGWNRQLSRSRRYRPRSTAGENSLDSSFATPADQANVSITAPSSLSMTFSNLPNLPNLSNGTANVSNVATDLLDAADKHVPTLGLNARRKFFHALAVVMFIPGVAVDPSFTHLSFSAAFALFIFTEYVRYFAIYPFGAAVHVFMNEFLDHRDRGTAILSHFYLLTGCAGSVWLEGSSQLLQFTGILTLGVGDAMASIIGRRMGTHRWSPSTFKTIEGSLAFVVSIVACAWALRMFGYAETFSIVRYTLVVAIASLLEALSDQNDNLTLPLYLWAALVLADV